MSNETNKTNFFWTSYADLLTSLFFIMLALYVVTFVVLKKEQAKYKADAQKLRRIQEIERSVNAIDSNYFAYNPSYKKHVLRVDVQFKLGSSDMLNISSETRQRIIEAGNKIKEQVEKFKDDNIKYLVIIEGQASHDNAPNHEASNYGLSYTRALSLLRFWKENDVQIGEGKLKNCELILAGSGEYGEPRDLKDDARNQRFLIHIIPKIGTLELKTPTQALTNNTVANNTVANNTVSLKNDKNSTIITQINLDNTLMIYTPNKLKYRYVTTKPPFNEDNYLCAAASFTTPEFTVDGISIVNGSVVNDKANYSINGCCLLSDNKIEILEGGTQLMDYVKAAKKDKISFFQQVLLIKNKQIIPCVLWKDSKNYRRALVEMDHLFSVVESKIPMSIKEFQAQLIAINAENALCLDMGAWSEGWYKNAVAQQIKIGQDFSKTAQQSSWLVLKTE